MLLRSFCGSDISLQEGLARAEELLCGSGLTPSKAPINNFQPTSFTVEDITHREWKSGKPESAGQAAQGLLCTEDWGQAGPEGHPELKGRLSGNRDVGGWPGGCTHKESCLQLVPLGDLVLGPHTLGLPCRLPTFHDFPERTLPPCCPLLLGLFPQGIFQTVLRVLMSAPPPPRDYDFLGTGLPFSQPWVSWAWHG